MADSTRGVQTYLNERSKCPNVSTCTLSSVESKLSLIPSAEKVK